MKISGGWVSLNHVLLTRLRGKGVATTTTTTTLGHLSYHHHLRPSSTTPRGPRKVAPQDGCVPPVWRGECENGNTARMQNQCSLEGVSFTQKL